MFDNPAIVQGKRVLDFGSGSGLAAIAAARCGAAHVVAYDLDPLAAEAQRLNAALNGATIESHTADATLNDTDAEVVLAGDVCYERESSQQTIAWLRRQSALRTVLIADPGRHYAPSDGLTLLATCDVPVLRELESVDSKRTRIWRLVTKSVSF